VSKKAALFLYAVETTFSNSLLSMSKTLSLDHDIVPVPTDGTVSDPILVVSLMGNFGLDIDVLGTPISDFVGNPTYASAVNNNRHIINNDEHALKVTKNFSFVLLDSILFFYFYFYFTAFIF
tara:strand:- start:97 stop:462 length:366 start_codon:yes stop_codon:yes gene_type:complete